MRHYSWQFTPLIQRAPFPTYRGQRPRAVTNATHKIQCQSGASGLPAVAGDAALDHFVAPAVACDDEAGQVATAETKLAKGDHDDELQQLTHRTSSGSFAIFAAIRRASSLCLRSATEEKRFGKLCVGRLAARCPKAATAASK